MFTWLAYCWRITDVALDLRVLFDLYSLVVPHSNYPKHMTTVHPMATKSLNYDDLLCEQDTL